VLLELGKAISFFVSILSIYPVAISAFFVPGSRWEERLSMALAKLVIAGCVCFISGLIFSWPARSNPEAGVALTSTLPVRLFFWAAAGGVALFMTSWYLVCGGGGVCEDMVNHACL